jgi:hypothetical protein
VQLDIETGFLLVDGIATARQLGHSEFHQTLDSNPFYLLHKSPLPFAISDAITIPLNKKKESHLSDSLDHQGASTSHIMASRGEGCHPSIEKFNKT